MSQEESHLLGLPKIFCDILTINFRIPSAQIISFPKSIEVEIQLAQPATMERITKIFFDPLATTRARVQDILEELPAGSAHPFSPDGVLLYRTAARIEEIDISTYPEAFFFNAIDMGELGETLQRRMAGFPSQLGIHFAIYLSGFDLFG